jgi:hypothetical protein
MGNSAARGMRWQAPSNRASAARVQPMARAAAGWEDLITSRRSSQISADPRKKVMQAFKDAAATDSVCGPAGSGSRAQVRTRPRWPQYTKITRCPGSCHRRVKKTCAADGGAQQLGWRSSKRGFGTMVGSVEGSERSWPASRIAQHPVHTPISACSAHLIAVAAAQEPSGEPFGQRSQPTAPLRPTRTILSGYAPRSHSDRRTPLSQTRPAQRIPTDMPPSAVTILGIRKRHAQHRGESSRPAT